jgi:amino acid permease
MHCFASEAVDHQQWTFRTQIQQLAGFIGIDGAPFLVCSGVYLAIFASIGIAGTKAVDFVNRIFVYGVLIALAGLLGVGVPEVRFDRSIYMLVRCAEARV